MRFHPHGVWLLKIFKTVLVAAMSFAAVMFAPWLAILLTSAYILSKLNLSTRTRVLLIPLILFGCNLLCFNIGELFMIPTFFALQQIVDQICKAYINHALSIKAQQKESLC